MFMTSNKKERSNGFSLVELLITIAIIGVLAVIAFTAFNSVLQNSRRQGDQRQAENIETAIQTLINETNIHNIVHNAGRFKVEPSHEGAPAFLMIEGHDVMRVDHEGVMSLITALQSKIYMRTRTGSWESYGPYLQAPRDDGEKTYASFAPQWNPSAGGKHVGYGIEIWPGEQRVSVTPAKAYDDDTSEGDELSSNFDPKGDFMLSGITVY